MTNILFYTTGDLATKRLTGGIKRFMELIRFGCSNNKDLVLCSQTGPIKLEELGVKNHIQMIEKKGDLLDKYLFPELALVRANYKTIKLLKRQNFNHIVVFDVPPAVGLVLMGFSNIILMLRKDMIGYENINTRHKSIRFYMKIFIQWLCEAICLIRSKRIITQCDYDRNQLIIRHPLLKKCIFRKTVIQINNVNPSWVKKNVPIAQPDDVFRVCFIGDFSNIRKGHDLLLGAAKLLLEEGHNMEFIVVGDGKELEQYKSMYLCNNIRFETLKVLG